MIGDKVSGPGVIRSRTMVRWIRCALYLGSKP